MQDGARAQGIFASGSTRQSGGDPFLELNACLKINAGLTATTVFVGFYARKPLECPRCRAPSTSLSFAFLAASLGLALWFSPVWRRGAVWHCVRAFYPW